MNRYGLAYAALVALVVGAEATAAAGGGGVAAFLQRPLCGPVVVWVLALFLPAKEIQARLVQLVDPSQKPDGSESGNG